MAHDSNNVPYVANIDKVNDEKVTVMSYEYR
jgi:hypothetical protein